MFKPKSAAKEEPRTAARNAALYRVVGTSADGKCTAGKAWPYETAMEIFDGVVALVPETFAPEAGARVKVISDVSYRAGGR